MHTFAESTNASVPILVLCRLSFLPPQMFANTLFYFSIVSHYPVLWLYVPMLVSWFSSATYTLTFFFSSMYFLVGSLPLILHPSSRISHFPSRHPALSTCLPTSSRLDLDHLVSFILYSRRSMLVVVIQGFCFCLVKLSLIYLPLFSCLHHLLVILLRSSPAHFLPLCVTSSVLVTGWHGHVIRRGSSLMVRFWLGRYALSGKSCRGFDYAGRGVRKTSSHCVAPESCQKVEGAVTSIT